MCYSTQTQTFSPTKHPLSPQHHDALADQWFVCWPIIELRPHLVRQAARAHPIVKVIGCSSLRGGGGELGTIKTLTYGSN